MRVYHLSSAPFSGGAARAGFRLHEGLLREPGVDSVWLDPGAGAQGEAVQALPAASQRKSLFARLRRRHWAQQVHRHFSSNSCPASNPMGWGTIDQFSNLPTPDVWNLHWVSWFLDWETLLPWMAEQAPIVWTLHDLNPLKGIWHYEPKSDELTERCLRLEEKASELKRRALSCIPRDRLTFVGPSEWMAQCCRESPITKGFPVEQIPYGLDHQVFLPRESTSLRAMFDIPADAFVIGFIADNINDPRKGIQSLLEALEKVGECGGKVHLLTVGNGRLPAGVHQHTHLGPIANDRFLSFFYSACDVFVCPSLQDNLPNTVLESLACGVPVIGYHVGGLPDMIDHPDTGAVISPVGDPEALSKAIMARFEGHELTLSTSTAARDKVLECYTMERQNAAYRGLYESAVSGEGRLH